MSGSMYTKLQNRQRDKTHCNDCCYQHITSKAAHCLWFWSHFIRFNKYIIVLICDPSSCITTHPRSAIMNSSYNITIQRTDTIHIHCTSPHIHKIQQCMTHFDIPIQSLVPQRGFEAGKQFTHASLHFSVDRRMKLLDPQPITNHPPIQGLTLFFLLTGHCGQWLVVFKSY